MTDLGTAWVVLSDGDGPLRDSDGWVLVFDDAMDAEDHAEGWSDCWHIERRHLMVIEAQCWVNHRGRWWADAHTGEEWPAQEL